MLFFPQKITRKRDFCQKIMRKGDFHQKVAEKMRFLSKDHKKKVFSVKNVNFMKKKKMRISLKNHRKFLAIVIFSTLHIFCS